jgi:hypothetical protein
MRSHKLSYASRVFPGLLLGGGFQPTAQDRHWKQERGKN